MAKYIGELIEMNNIPIGMKRNLRTMENPFIHLGGDKYSWDYKGNHEVVHRNYHKVDGKPTWIQSVVIWDGTYKKK